MYGRTTFSQRQMLSALDAIDIATSFVHGAPTASFAMLLRAG
jgi:hypothetical protein